MCVRNTRYVPNMQLLQVKALVQAAMEAYMLVTDIDSSNNCSMLPLGIAQSRWSVAGDKWLEKTLISAMQ